MDNEKRHVLELGVARTVYEELSRLSGRERDRVMAWVGSRLAADAGSTVKPPAGKS